jgi:hypothetical protein
MWLTRRDLRERAEALGEYALAMEKWSRGAANKPVGRPFTIAEYQRHAHETSPRWWRVRWW